MRRGSAPLARMATRAGTRRLTRFKLHFLIPTSYNSCGLWALSPTSKEIPDPEFYLKIIRLFSEFRVPSSRDKKCLQPELPIGNASIQ